MSISFTFFHHLCVFLCSVPSACFTFSYRGCLISVSFIDLIPFVDFFFSHRVYSVLFIFVYSLSPLSHRCLLFHTNLQWRDDALAPNPFIWRITKVWLDIRVKGGEGEVGWDRAREQYSITIQSTTRFLHSAVASLRSWWIPHTVGFGIKPEQM